MKISEQVMDVMKETSSTIAIGIDLGDRKYAVCVLDAKGAITHDPWWLRALMAMTRRSNIG
jgi:hypothetical protein